ncbi:BBSome complex assembly protein BBS10 isoform X1 [Denticeps clupeoides]|uniref:BBSome complex assembly protein BBS10 isoform X1 n=1 Tax=Denticeps clupeoides TaxID=299321 RepID=UPI0010A3B8C6|nr:Bardet-Biedl syndrome 10 protein homolog isoform X1 [Denticeps clupeoides]
MKVGMQPPLLVVSALRAAVLRCFGPRGGSVFFTRDTGDVLVTRHGQKILRSLQLEHPAARLIVDCVHTHCQIAADGSKSFLLLLSSLLSEMVSCCGASWDSATARRLAQRLLQFCWTGLDDVIARGVTQRASSLAICGYHGDVVEGLVRGYMAGRVGDGPAKVLSPLVCRFYQKWSGGVRGAEPVAVIHTHFSLLHTAVSGLPIGCSGVAEGLVLERDWSAFFEHGPRVEVLVLAASVCPAAEPGRGCVCDRCVAWPQVCVCAQQLGACVLLSAAKQPDWVLQWARRNRVCLAECLDPERLDLLCLLGQSRPTPAGRVATATSVRRLVLGGRRLAAVVPAHAPRAHTLLLCGPGPGPLDQSVSACRGAVAMLHHVFEEDQSQSPAADCWAEALGSGRLLPVGGAFELLLHDFLLSSDWTGDPQVSRLLARAVLSVPGALHSHKPRHFLQLHAHFLRQGSGGPSRPWSGGLESVAAKRQLLSAVLQCAAKLLTVETVLRVHAPLRTSRSDEEED